MASEVIKLNLIPSGEMPTYHCSQFDNGREILIDLFNGEDEYSLPAGYTAELHTRKMDNNIVTLATTSVSSNHLTFTSTEQLTACAGNNLSDVSIKDASDYVVGTLNFWLYVKKNPLQGGLTSTSAIHDLTDQIEEITTEIVGENYYNKSETDDFLDLKADKSTTYTKTEVNTLLNSKADASSVYTKSETNTLLSTKADANGVYNKVEVDAMVDDLEDAIDLKADAATTYTKTQVDTALALKADAATTYTKTEVDTALALKANAADVYTKTEVDNIILDIMPVGTASGPIASFNTALAADYQSVTVKVVATGGNGTPDNPNPIVGYSSANITRCGVNLWDEQWERGTISTSTGENAPSTTQIRSVNYIPVKPSTTYYNKGYAITVYQYDINKAFLGYSTVQVGTFTTDAQTCYIRFWRTATTYNNDISINYPATDTNYHAYNGQTYAIAFGQTVYGGVLDVTRGKLHVTYVEMALGTGFAKDGNNRYYKRLGADFNAKVYSGNEVANALCECYNPISQNNYNGRSLTGVTIAISLSQPTIMIYDANYNDTAANFDALIKDYKLAYELATPFDIDLKPVQIRALVGENNVYSDTNGNTTVQFKDSIQHYIDTHTGG